MSFFFILDIGTLCFCLIVHCESTSATPPFHCLFNNYQHSKLEGVGSVFHRACHYWQFPSIPSTPNDSTLESRAFDLAQGAANHISVIGKICQVLLASTILNLFQWPHIMRVLLWNALHRFSLRIYWVPGKFPNLKYMLPLKTVVFSESSTSWRVRMSLCPSDYLSWLIFQWLSVRPMCKHQ